MQDHTIICQSCNTRVAKTPNQVCIKCKAPRWGYTAEELNGTVPIQPRNTPPQQPLRQPFQNQAGNVNPSVSKLICKNCKTLVARTPDNKCVNCSKVKWGYSDRQLKKIDGIGVGGSGFSVPPVNKSILIGGGALIVFVIIGWVLINIFWKPNIYEKYHNSVVMLYSEFTYTISINGKSIYFNYDEDRNMITSTTSTLDSAAANPMGLFGTGFFIDKQGRIVTNRHVVHHFSTEDEANCRNLVRNEFRQKIDTLSKMKDNATNEISIYTSDFYHNHEIGDTLEEANDKQKLTQWRMIQDAADSKKALYESFLSGLPDAKFGVNVLFIGYATDGTTANRKSDFRECQILNYSKDEDIDLGIIQTNTHKLPEGLTNYISVNDLGNASMKVGDEVSLLGYNNGRDLGVTKTGLHVQKIDGKISQESDGSRVLYSINALAGSSGSPVFSSSGKLVAVHYASYRGGAGFDYGILATHIQKLLNEE
ncbi:MAG: hypothetical protein JWQ66_162 [Mucilaginibacter sp.]|nr:hypothetical protein [Mucilaginibacter sp.]